MAFNVDPSTEYGQRVLRRLDEEQNIWLGVVNEKGEPVTTLVWFLHEGDGQFYLVSQPTVGKVHAIRQNPNVVLHLNSGFHGDDMIVLNGTAELLSATAAESTPAKYLKKYDGGFKSLNQTPEQMLADFSQPIRIQVNRVRGH